MHWINLNISGANSIVSDEVFHRHSPQIQKNVLPIFPNWPRTAF